MSSKKENAELELEKQYREYRAQFELWKEKNKSSVGTDAYNQYVKQFEEWEKDVERRRKTIRDKAEKEAQEARIAAEEEEREKRVMAQKEAEAAEAYLQSQQSYLAHHQAAMEAEQRQQQQTHIHTVQYQAQAFASAKSEGSSIAVAAMAATVGVPQGPVAGPAAAPQLWGNHKLPYDLKDPLFSRWGMRAAPAHTKPVLHQPQVPQACWMVMEHLKEKRKILAPHVTLPPPSLFSIATHMPTNGAN